MSRLFTTTNAIRVIILSLIGVSATYTLGIMPLWLVRAICVTICAGAGLAGYIMGKREKPL